MGHSAWSDGYHIYLCTTKNENSPSAKSSTAPIQTFVYSWTDRKIFCILFPNLDIQQLYWGFKKRTFFQRSIHLQNSFLKIKGQAKRNKCKQICSSSLTLGGLGAYVLLDQGICSLCVKAKRVLQWLQLWTLLQVVLLQAVSSSMEILLCKNDQKPFSPNSFQHTGTLWRTIRMHSVLCVCA